jgi:pimeloyl-ACP methyl ester carboxylesterase
MMLMEIVLNLYKRPVSILGYCLGAAVGVGFAAKHPELCKNLILISPIGIKTSFLSEYKVLLKRYCVGEAVIRARSTLLAEKQKSHYFNESERSIHWPLIQKQMGMIRFQLENTPGYLGALLSAYREFPFRLEELLTVVGLHSRPVLILWGDRDIICPYKTSIHRIEPCFPNAFIVDIRNCGHNPIFEKYNDVASEIIDFYANVFKD